MSFLVQNDAGSIEDANAYISVAFFESYWTDRGYDYSGFDSSEIEIAIVKATDYVDGRFAYEFSGSQKTLAQQTQWPRLAAYDSSGNYVGEMIPNILKKAISEYAKRALISELVADPVRNEYGKSVKAKSTKIDVITTSIEYDNDAGFEMPEYPMADKMIDQLTHGGGKTNYISRC